MKICGQQFDVIGNLDFKLEPIVAPNLNPVREEIEEITDGAEKQLKIEE
jgi:hypothetical protein